MEPTKSILTHRPSTPRTKQSFESWWAPLWRGLVVSRDAKHYSAMHTSIWLFAYLLVHADRKTGRLYRKIETIASQMGIKPRTIRHWLQVLRKSGYIATSSTGRSLEITIQKWKPLEMQGKKYK